MVTNYFKRLFSNDFTCESSCFAGAFPVLSHEELASFEKEVTKSDIFNVIDHMGGLQAPDPDGLQAIFLQSQWSIVGDSFCKMIF